MTICADCAWEADAVKTQKTTHDDIRLANLLHRKNRQPIRGHSACKGCDCAHEEVKRPGE